jgi:hypothetical protein
MCDNRVTWAVLPKGETQALPSCDSHLGGILSVINKKDGPTFAFGYVGDQDFKEAKCIGDLQGVSVKLSLTPDVLVLQEPPANTMKMKADCFVEVR